MLALEVVIYLLNYAVVCNRVCLCSDDYSLYAFFYSMLQTQ